MAHQRLMRRFAQWHIWLGWLIGVPILMWTITGLVMVIRPLEEVRGSDRLIAAKPQPLPADTAITVALPAPSTKPVVSVTTRMERGEAVTRIAYADGTTARFRGDGTAMGPLSEVEARLIARDGVRGGDQVVASRRFTADQSPPDFRKPIPGWQITLADGTHVYVGMDSAQIEGVRTPFWRLYDVMWGLHIMDLQTRENPHNPFIITFALLALTSSLLGTILMFRRRKARVAAKR